ncbi:HupE/UreJ family protein [Nostoc sp. UHCC 0302]|uniref:HupE/UreJ family protein n=1 Tax=Nostoc sp. UHCC 0302 TaxID=3134896 RepID=UPI00311CA36C
MMFKIELLESPASKLQHRHIGAIAALIVISLLSSLAGTPKPHLISNCWQGFIWGLADPVISLNCLAGIVTIGLLSAGVVRSASITLGFVLAAVLGIAIHLCHFNFSGVEIAIGISTIASGIMLVIPKQLNFMVLALLSVTAGWFQGYANAESITGAEMIPLIAYILGMTLTQFAVAMSAKEIGSAMLMGETNGILPKIRRFAGFAFCAIGIVFLSNLVI